MKKSIVFALLICLGLAGITQNHKIGVNPSARENIEYKALSPSFYLVKQDYVLVDKNNNQIGRAGNDYFGFMYGIGIICNRKLYYTTNIRTPWLADKNYSESEYGDYTPQCSKFNTRSIEDDKEEFKSFNIVAPDLAVNIESFNFGIKGVELCEELPTEATVIIFHTKESHSPELDDINNSVIRVDGLVWENGVCMIPSPFLGDRIVLGAVMFYRKIETGMITWDAVGLVTSMGIDKWQIDALENN